MKLINKEITLDKTIVVGEGDKITYCRIHVPEHVSPAIYIPPEVVESGNYQVDHNIILND